MNIRLLLGLVLMVVALGLPYIKDAIPAIPLPDGPSITETLNIPMPEIKYLEKSKSLDNVSNKDDRVSLALFTYEFANRVPRYETDVQTYNDIYAYAAKKIYQDTMVGKYDNIREFVGSKALESVLGDRNGYVTDDQKQELSNQFMSHAWVLGGGQDE